jgi:hypothetical protein
MHGGAPPGAPKGNRNAFRHGRYTAEEIARRRDRRPRLEGRRPKYLLCDLADFFNRLPIIEAMTPYHDASRIGNSYEQRD